MSQGEGPIQLPLQLTRDTVDKASLQEGLTVDRLSQLVGRSISSLTWTSNRTRILSVGQDDSTPPQLTVRLDRCFLLAPESVLRAIARWVGAETPEVQRRALVEIREFFAASRPMEDRQRTMPILRPVGQYFDLGTLRDDLNRQYFQGKLEVAVTWGRASGKRRRRARSRTIRLGSYDQGLGLIRIHPVLDAADVPQFVVESVLFHELLHVFLPVTTKGGRRRLHPPEFREMERRFDHYEEARQWIDNHLERLLRRR